MPRPRLLIAIPTLCTLLQPADAQINQLPTPARSKGSVSSSVAIDASLRWLAKHQDKDGRWDSDQFMKHDPKGRKTKGAGKAHYDVGLTGLALLAFLGDGNTMRTGPYRDTIKAAVKFLRNQQGDAGLFGVPETHDFIYNHAIATYAICEAYGLSQYRILKPFAQRGIDFLEKHRNPRGVWRYDARSGDNDTSITSWGILAYRAAADFGLQVNPKANASAIEYLDAVTDPEDGRCGYTTRGQRSSRLAGNHAQDFPAEKSEALTAAGLFLRFMMSQDPDETPVMERAADTLLTSPPAWDDRGGIDFYYWFYGSYAMYQVGGEHWKKWRAAVVPTVLKNQRRDGSASGSWDPVSVWSGGGGRVYSTAMCTLTLQASYRYGRLNKGKK